MNQHYWVVKTSDGDEWGRISRLIIDPTTRQIVFADVILNDTGRLVRARLAWDSFDIGRDGVVLRSSDEHLGMILMQAEEPAVMEALRLHDEIALTVSTENDESGQEKDTDDPTNLGSGMSQRPVRILGLGGSLSKASSSLAALKLALQGAEDAGAITELLDVSILNLPMFVPGSRDLPESVRVVVNTVSAADGLIWSSPVYHGTISGLFKNALDWLDRLDERDPAYLSDKVVGLISTAGGTQGLQAINTMEFIVRALRGWTVPLVLPIARARKLFDKRARIVDVEMEARLRALGGEVTRAARQFQPRRPPSPGGRPATPAPLLPQDGQA